MDSTDMDVVDKRINSTSLCGDGGGGCESNLDTNCNSLPIENNTSTTPMMTKAMVTLRLEMNIQPSSIHSNSSLGMTSMLGSRSLSAVGDVLHPVNVTVEYPEDIQVNVNAVIVSSSSIAGNIHKTMPISSAAEMQKVNNRTANTASMYSNSAREITNFCANQPSSMRHAGGTKEKIDEVQGLDVERAGGGGDDNDSLYQTVLMGNDSLTGCAISDSNIKFGNLSVINPTAVSSSGLFSMQANAGSLEDFEEQRNLRQDGDESADEGHGDYVPQDGDEGDGIYPYTALTGTEEGQELELKVFEEQERVICESVGFGMNSRTADDLQPQMSRQRGRTPNPLTKSRTILTNSNCHHDYDVDVTGADHPEMSSKYKHTVNFNNTEDEFKQLLHEMVGNVAKIKIINDCIGKKPEKILIKHPQKVPSFTRSSVPVSAHLVSKACLSSTIPMQSHKTATAELRFFSTKKPVVDNQKNTFISDYKDELRHGKQDVYTGSFHGKENRKFNVGYGAGHGHSHWGKPHSCSICFPVPDDAIALLRKKIGLTSKEARDAAYELFKYLKEQRHTNQVQEVMKYVQPDLFKGRGFAARRFEDEDSY